MAAQINYRVNAIIATKGDLAKAMAKKAEAVGGLGSKLDVVTGKLRAFGGGMAGSAASTGAAFAKAGLMGGAAGVAAGVGMVAAKGFEANASLEGMRNTVAGTLQLYGHSANRVDQLGTNIKVAGAALERLNKIAADSPGEVSDVSTMFQNMLPGARSVTGEMSRIMRLTQNLALFTPTLTSGDFMTSGAQMSRILTGSAGAEMDTWKRIAPVVLQVGKEMDKVGGHGKVFGKNMVEAGEKFTMAFNKLSGEQRLRLIEEAFQRGGPELAKMYADSWEGASAAFKSGWKRIAAAGTKPMFDSLKAAVIKAVNGGSFGEKTIANLMHAAQTIGILLERPFMRGVHALENAILYLNTNWRGISNTIYHAFQVGEAAIKGAFAFGVTKLVSGLALAGAGSLFGGVTKGVGTFRKGLAATRPVATKAAERVSGFFAALSFGSDRLFRFSTTALPKMLGLAFAIVPLIAVAGLATLAFGGLFVVVGGIAAYITSKWAEISASIRKGFEDGSVTLRPLVIAALTLWERLKALGSALIGGYTGATMMQGAINLAASAVNGISTAVGMLMDVAAEFIRWIGTAADMADKIFGKTEASKDIERTQDLMARSTMGFNDAWNVVQKKRAAGEYREETYTDRANRVANKIGAAARVFNDTGVKNLNFEEVEQMTGRVNNMVKDLFAGDTADKKNPRGNTTNIGTLNMNVELREKDPDRLMRGLFEPIEKLARNPTASAYDAPGF